MGGSNPEFVIGRRGSGSHGTGRLRLLRSSGGEILGISLVVEPQEGDRNDRRLAGRGQCEEIDRQRYGFIETLAHELRNPLTAILSAAQMLQRYGATKPEVVNWAGSSIERQVRHMSAGVNDWLDLARAMVGKLELS